MFEVEEIKRQVKIEDVLRMEGITLSRGRCACPIHHGKDKNFSVKGDNFKCFVCGESGDVIELWQKINGVSFRQAISELAATFGISGTPTLDMVRRQVDRERQKQFDTLAAEVWKHTFEELTKERRERWLKGDDIHLYDTALDFLERTKAPVTTAALKKAIGVE